MRSCTPFVVFIGLHDDAWVGIEVELAKLRVVAQTLSGMLEVKVGEEARVYMLSQQLSQLEYVLIYNCL